MQTVMVTAGILVQGKRVLVTQRNENDLRGLLWEFPGGKVKEEEDPKEALRRELKEELDIEVEVGRISEVVFHPYPEYPILLLAYTCRILRGIPKPIGCHNLQWASFDELKRLAMTPADEPIRKLLGFLHLGENEKLV